jgi:formate/nitrite transporter FocA (FNT family)
MSDETEVREPRQDNPDQMESLTEREKVRSQEDQEFIPVIVKRTDEARRHPDDILQTAIEEGYEQLNRRSFSLFLSAVGAGLILGFVAMAVAVVSTALVGVESETVRRVAVALVYPLGFVVCIMSGTELFTEHTATAVYPVLDRKAGVARLLRLWAIVGIGNLVGTLASAILLTVADDVIGARPGYIEVGHHLVGVDLLPLIVSAMLAGWLMALGAWLILATPPRMSQIASIYIVTFLIGLGGLHHSIAGSAEMLTAYLIGDRFTLAQSVRFIGVALLGNLAGGSLFVAGLNYAHIRQSQVAVESAPIDKSGDH